MVSVPTTGKVRKIWKAWHYRFNFESYEDSAERFDAWLAEHDREVKAEAWGEGHWEGWQNAREALLTDMFGGPTLNPYRQGETE